MTVRFTLQGQYVKALALLSFFVIVCGFGCNQVANTGQITGETFKGELPFIPPAWEPPRSLLTVDETTFSRAIKRQGWEKGKWYILLISSGCVDCYPALRAMNQWAEKGNQCVAVGHQTDNSQLTEAFKRQIAGFDLRFPVKILSSWEYRETGAMIVPTLVEVKDGKWMKAMDVSLGFPLMTISNENKE